VPSNKDNFDSSVSICHQSLESRVLQRELRAFKEVLKTGTIADRLLTPVLGNSCGIWRSFSFSRIALFSLLLRVGIAEDFLRCF
jgi:hypothetical protein